MRPSITSGTSVSKIARNNYISTSNLTRKIKALEGTWGCKLFYREQGHGMKPTKIALDLKPHIDSIIREFGSIARRIQEDGKQTLRVPITTMSFYPLH